MLLTEEPRVTVLRSGVTPGSAFGKAGGDLQEYGVALYPDDDDANEWEWDNVAPDSEVDVRATLYWDFHATIQFCRSFNVLLLEDANGVSSLALQNLTTVSEQGDAVPAKSATLESFHVVEDATNAAFPAWKLEKIDLGCKCNEELGMKKSLDTD